MTDKQSFPGWGVDRVKVNKSFSEETLCFRAEVYLDGKHVGFAFNDGHGGSTGLSHKPGQEHVAFPPGLVEHIDVLVDDVQQIQDLQRTYKRWVKQIMAGKVFALRADENKAWEEGTDHQESSAPPFRVYSSPEVAAKHLAGHDHIIYHSLAVNALWQKMYEGHYKWKAMEDARFKQMLADEEEKFKNLKYDEPPASPQMPDGY